MATPPRFTERIGRSEPRAALYEGVPAHLFRHVHDAIETAVGRLHEAQVLALAARLEIPLSTQNAVEWQVVYAASKDENTALDLLDALLRASVIDETILDQYLTLGGSAYTATSSGLEVRVSSEERAAYAAAVAATDPVSEELEAAWGHAFGMKPDASDAWDHSIKAIENLLAGVVIPSNPKATLGAILSAIEAKPSKWSLGLASSGKLTDVEALAAMLRLIWPNPDRHGGSGPTRKPTLDEATRVVQLTVAIVNLCRSHFQTTTP